MFETCDLDSPMRAILLQEDMRSSGLHRFGKSEPVIATFLFKLSPTGCSIALAGGTTCATCFEAGHEKTLIDFTQCIVDECTCVLSCPVAHPPWWPS